MKMFERDVLHQTLRQLLYMLGCPKTQHQARSGKSHGGASQKGLSESSGWDATSHFTQIMQTVLLHPAKKMEKGMS